MSISTSQNGWCRATLMTLLVALVACSGTPSETDGGTADSGNGQVEDGGNNVTPDGGPFDAGSEPDAGQMPGVGETGSFCESDAHCQSLVCLTSEVCSEVCEATETCPNVSWVCGQDQGRVGVCVCAITEEGTDICDGEDNDCNGIVDDVDTATCPGLRKCTNGDCVCPPENNCGFECVDKLVNTKHCGACNNSCDRGAICDEGVCTCDGQTCNGACVDTTTDNLNCGGCGVPCGRDSDCAQSACVDADREWTRWPIGSGFLQGANSGEVTDYDTKLVWEAEHRLVAYTAQEADAYCAGLPHPDGSPWRLPTRAELLSIVDYDRDIEGGKAAAIAPGFTITPASLLMFWSATDAANATPAKRWAVNFSDGQYESYILSAKYYVRCVRTDLN